METEWKPKIGDHVWHVAEYSTNVSGMRKRGLDGFRPYGLEVVESEITSVLDNSTYTALGIVTSDRIGNVDGSNIFRWSQHDLGKVVFPDCMQAAEAAQLRCRDMEHGYMGNVYENRPMYKNWLHWVNTDRTPALRSRKKEYVHVLPGNWNMDVYNEWLNGLSCKDAGKKCGVSAATFNIHARRLANERGDVRKRNLGGRKDWVVLPDNFNDVCEEYAQGLIKQSEAARKCGMTHSKFKYQFDKLQRRRAKAGIEWDCPKPQKYEPKHVGDIALGNHNYKKQMCESAE